MKYIITILTFITAAQAIHSQSVIYISSGSDFTIRANEEVYFNGMVLTPSSDFTIYQNSITKNTAIVNPATNPGSAIRRAYKFSANTDAFAGSIRVYYTQVELGAADESGLVVNVHNGSAWSDIATASRDVTNNYVESQPGSFVALNEVTATSINSILPLQWGDIKALRQDGNADISFTCYNIAAVDYFQVQKSVDDHQWNTVAMINQPTAGNQSFQITDTGVSEEKLFYRVASVDADGSRSYSKIVSVAPDQQAQEIILQPNPAPDNFILKGVNAASVKNISLVNISGMRVRNWQSCQASYNIGGLPAGMYFVKILFTNGQQDILKLLK